MTKCIFSDYPKNCRVPTGTGKINNFFPVMKFFNFYQKVSQGKLYQEIKRNFHDEYKNSNFCTFLFKIDSTLGTNWVSIMNEYWGKY